MRAQSRGIVQPFLSKAFAESQTLRMIPGEFREVTLPEVVRALMAEVTKQRATVFAELLAVEAT